MTISPELEIPRLAPAVRERIGGLRAEEVELLTMAVVEIDFAGKILMANQAARALFDDFSGLGAPSSLVGKLFFKEVCPWASSPLFFGRIVQGLRRLNLDEYFSFAARIRGRLQLLGVHAALHLPTRRLWLFFYPSLDVAHGA